MYVLICVQCTLMLTLFVLYFGLKPPDMDTIRKIRGVGGLVSGVAWGFGGYRGGEFGG